MRIPTHILSSFIYNPHLKTQLEAPLRKLIILLAFVLTTNILTACASNAEQTGRLANGHALLYL